MYNAVVYIMELICLKNDKPTFLTVFFHTIACFLPYQPIESLFCVWKIGSLALKLYNNFTAGWHSKILQRFLKLKVFEQDSLSSFKCSRAICQRWRANFKIQILFACMHTLAELPPMTNAFTKSYCLFIFSAWCRVGCGTEQYHNSYKCYRYEVVMLTIISQVGFSVK